MLAISVVTYLVAHAFYEFQIFLLGGNCASRVNTGRLSLGHVCCFLLEDHSSFFTSTIDILVGKQQNIPVATYSTSVCTSERTFSPEYVVLCYTVSILFALNLVLKGLLVSVIGLLRRWNYSSFLNEKGYILRCTVLLQ